MKVERRRPAATATALRPLFACDLFTGEPHGYGAPVNLRLSLGLHLRLITL
jgi:hypothetical protein